MQYYQGKYPILEKNLLAKNIVQYMIFCPEIATVAQPGQFVHILPTGHTLRRPISLCEIHPEKGTICIVFELKGSGTEMLANCNVGDCMDVLGPLGHGFTLLPNAQHVVLLGGGIGNPPMLPLAQYYQKRAAVISGFRSAEFVILQDAFQATEAETILCTDNGTAGRYGLVTEPLQELLNSQTIDAIYACGPKPMLHAIATIANEKDVFCEVSLEERMGCGIGACLVCACQIERENKSISAHVCKDGPVFSAKEVVWS